MNNIVKKLYIGRCYVCGKPIREDDMYGTMEDSDTLYCESCWNEYAERCDALIEQMKKEKAEPSTNENVESKCGKIDDKLFEKEWKRYMSSKKDDLSGRAVSVNVKDIARHFAEWQMAQDKKTIEVAEDNAMLAGRMKMKGEMMKGAVQAEVGYFTKAGLFFLEGSLRRHGLKEGDKVKLIIIKDDDSNKH